jgi:hypothetical protein
MSGVEAAGLVLAVIPLLVSGLEFYARGVATSRRFGRYRQEFESLARELKTEETVLENSINHLLTGVIRSNDMPAFLSDPQGQQWKNANLEKKLRGRLGTSYEVYMGTVQHILETTEQFQARLRLTAQGQPQFTDIKSFKTFYRRLKFSLCKSEYDDLMSKLHQANRTLCLLTNQRISLNDQAIESNRRKQLRPNFRAIHDRAKGFHSTLLSGWKCSCWTDHTVNLQLESRISGHGATSEQEDDEEEDDEVTEPSSEDDPFHVLFCYNEQSFNNPGKLAVPWIWEEAKVRLVCGEDSSTTATTVKSARTVQFSAEAKKAVRAALEPMPNMQPIQDLCATIGLLQGPQREICFSLLASEYQKQVGLRPPILIGGKMD